MSGGQRSGCGGSEVPLAKQFALPDRFLRNSRAATVLSDLNTSLRGDGESRGWR